MFPLNFLLQKRRKYYYRIPVIWSWWRPSLQNVTISKQKELQISAWSRFEELSNIFQTVTNSLWFFEIQAIKKNQQMPCPVFFLPMVTPDFKVPKGLRYFDLNIRWLLLVEMSKTVSFVTKIDKMKSGHAIIYTRWNIWVKIVANTLKCNLLKKILFDYSVYLIANVKEST